MQSFKVKIGGRRLLVRKLTQQETIGEKVLQTFGKPDVSEMPNYNWQPTTCVGEKVSEHPDRTYLEVLSKFF